MAAGADAEGAEAAIQDTLSAAHPQSVVLATPAEGGLDPVVDGGHAGADACPTTHSGRVWSDEGAKTGPRSTARRHPAV